MKVTALKINDFSFSLVNGNTDEYVVEAIDGLGPTERILKTIGYDNNSKPIYETTASPREVVLQLKLNPNPGNTYSSLRDALYTIVQPSVNGKVKLQLMDGATVLTENYGVVKHIESTMFTNIPRVQITIDYDTGLFNSPTIQDAASFGITGSSMTINVPYSGTAPTGFGLHLAAYGMTDFRIDGDDGAGNRAWTFDAPTSSLASSINTLELNSDKELGPRGFGDLHLVFGFGGYYHTLVSNITDDSVWPMLYPGNNRLVFTAPGATTFNWSTSSRISVYPKFLGV